MKNYKLYVEGMLQAMESAEAFVLGMEFDDFQADDKTAGAVVENLPKAPPKPGQLGLFGKEAEP